MRRPTATAVLAVSALLIVTGCSGGSPSRGPAPSSSRAGAPTPSAGSARGSAEVVATAATRLASPWGVAPLPGGDLLIGSRDTGTVVRVGADGGRRAPLGTVPDVAAAGEGGLLGLAASPRYPTDHLLYAYVTTGSDNRIVRMPVDEGAPEGRRLGAPAVVLRGIPKGTVHNGGRIAFGPDGMLYAGTGESGRRGLAQDRASLGGKILRLTPEGRPAPGNPDPGSVVYSYGHRNVQGLAWDAERRLWASEFGQDTWDELNVVEPGGNYGWPQAEGTAHRPGLKDPVVQWRTADASPSGLAYAAGSLWMAGLRGERLWRIPLRGATAAAEPRPFLQGNYGRLRTVVPLGDDGLWLTTSNTDGRGSPAAGDDRLLRLKVT
ncbi:PQQ-dependent sugar dehydrogenase [Streptomyces sp. SCA3-4]|uniref:PQQ-dependent sugar dehydrogenase n=1 Tax=Streptomyces sichuanensis TaxID=2871810 RepID=UPI001CE34CB2|nr:PQQ-dependent sugar dehydrogenase [Streptomyces sichuanensis]MCA6094161.1 PQQ-dependent sugar dehydrogenase [Streptomyces sichuanensis]